MTTFTVQGNAWNIGLTYGGIRRLRDETGVDLMLAAEDPAAFDRAFFAESHKLVDVALSLIAPQLAARSVTADQFRDQLDADGMEALTAGLMAEWCDFFRRSPIARWIVSEGGPAAVIRKVRDEDARRAGGAAVPTAEPAAA